MGNDFGQFLEWRIHEGLEWQNLTDEMNAKHLHFMETLNAIYKKERALWEIDHQAAGIEILNADNADETVLTFIRKGKKPRDFVVVICNFVPVERKNYRVGVPFEGVYEECLNTEMSEYGGVWTRNQGPLRTVKETTNQKDHTIELIVPAMSVVILRPKRVFGVPKS